MERKVRSNLEDVVGNACSRDPSGRHLRLGGFSRPVRCRCSGHRRKSGGGFGRRGVVETKIWIRFIFHPFSKQWIEFHETTSGLFANLPPVVSVHAYTVARTILQ